MPATPLDTATAVFKAIDRVADVVAQYLSGAAMRRMKYRVDAAMQYVFVDERAGEHKDISDNRREELKLHFRKRIFDE